VVFKFVDMEEIIKLTAISISFGIGLFMGTFWMFLITYKHERKILKDLKYWKDLWETKYVDDDEEY